jgi:hypothetical protein
MIPALVKTDLPKPLQIVDFFQSQIDALRGATQSGRIT